MILCSMCKTYISYYLFIFCCFKSDTILSASKSFKSLTLGFVVLQIILEIRKEEDYRIPIWVIVGSTLGGLQLLALLILALWKVGNLINK